MDINGNLNNQRTFVVGDLHGYVHPLIELLQKVDFDYEEDRLISMGDLCDRGPDTWGVIEHLLKVKNLILIKGNHDPWLQQWLDTTVQDRIWLYNGGMTTIKSYISSENKNIDKHLELLKSALPYYKTIHNGQRICFVHGGFDKNHFIHDQNPESLMWDRELIMQAMSAGPKRKLKTKDEFDMIFVGHTPTLYWDESVPGKGLQPIYKPIYSGGIWNVDTGCGKGGRLTLMNLDTLEYIQSEEKLYSMNG